MPPETVIEFIKVNVGFNGQPVLSDLTLSVAGGQKFALVGESSSGKSTLFKTLVGLIKPDAGTVKLFGKDIGPLSSREIMDIRHRLSIQFQAGAMFDSYTVLDNILLARQESARTKAQAAKARDRQSALQLLAAVGLSKAADRFPHALSGGMRKRAALARALATDSEIILFDEPTAGLDPVTSRRIIDLVNTLSSQRKASMILATTDMEVARSFCDNFLVLHQGRIWAQGTLSDLQASQDSFVQKMLGRLL